LGRYGTAVDSAESLVAHDRHRVHVYKILKDTLNNPTVLALALAAVVVALTVYQFAF
jgi:hypothetical protein